MDYYARLGLGPAATFEEINQAARRALWAGRPSREEATQVCRAWFTLRDPERREAYDAVRPAFGAA